MLATISGTEGALGGVAATFAIIGGVAFILRMYIRQVMGEVKPNGGDSDSAGDVLLRAGKAIGEMQKRQKREIKQVRKEIASVHTELRTLNGLTIGELADRTEGRRIEADVKGSDQTSSERLYVEALNEPEGHK